MAEILDDFTTGTVRALAQPCPLGLYAIRPLCLGIWRKITTSTLRKKLAE